MNQPLERIESRKKDEGNVFGDLDLSLLRLSRDKDQDSISVNIEGEQFIVKGEVKISKFNRNFLFTIEHDNEVVLEYVLTNDLLQNLIRTRIKRLDESKKVLPRYSGIHFYTKMLDFIDGLPKKDPTIHHAVRSPQDHDREKWDERFVELLEIRGYEKKDKGSRWEKEYPANTL